MSAVKVKVTERKFPRDWISKIAQSREVTKTVRKAAEEAFFSATIDADELGRGWRYHYVLEEAKGEWGKTQIITATSRPARSAGNFLREAALTIENVRER